MANKYMVCAHIIADNSTRDEIKLDEIILLAQFSEFTNIGEVFGAFQDIPEPNQTLKSIAVERTV